jgi:antirestriction protein ArdC
MASQDRGDIYSRITADIIAAIEAGAGEFRMPWHHDGTSTARPVNVASNKPYRGVNTLALWAAATHANHGSGIWGTYQQWNAKGAQVRRGERGTTVVFWKIDGQNDKSGRDEEDDQEAGRHRVFARAYTVFNSAQVDGYTSPELPVLADDERIEQADRFCSNLGIEVRHGGDRAFYSPASDFVQMPQFQRFKDSTSYYAVLLHECGHNAAFRIMPRRCAFGRTGLAHRRGLSA